MEIHIEDVALSVAGIPSTGIHFSLEPLLLTEGLTGGVRVRADQPLPADKEIDWHASYVYETFAGTQTSTATQADWCFWTAAGDCAEIIDNHPVIMPAGSQQTQIPQETEIPIRAIEDNLIDTTEFFWIVLGPNASSITHDLRPRTKVKINDRGPANMCLQRPAETIKESDGMTDYTVTLNHPLDETVNFVLEFHMGEIEDDNNSFNDAEPADLTGVTSLSGEFPPGVTSVDVQLPIATNDSSETLENFHVELRKGNLAGDNVILCGGETSQEWDQTIDDSSNSLSITVTGTTIPEPENFTNDVSTGEAKIHLGGDYSSSVTVHYSVTDRNASYGTDYTVNDIVNTIATGSVEFTVGGSRNHTIPIEVLGDLLAEPDETFFIAITGVDTSEQVDDYSDEKGDVTILDNDGNERVEDSFKDDEECSCICVCHTVGPDKLEGNVSASLRGPAAGIAYSTASSTLGSRMATRQLKVPGIGGVQQTGTSPVSIAMVEIFATIPDEAQPTGYVSGERYRVTNSSGSLAGGETLDLSMNLPPFTGSDQPLAIDFDVNMILHYDDNDDGIVDYTSEPIQYDSTYLWSPIADEDGYLGKGMSFQFLDYLTISPETNTIYVVNGDGTYVDYGTYGTSGVSGGYGVYSRIEPVNYNALPTDVVLPPGVSSIAGLAQTSARYARIHPNGFTEFF